MTPEPADKQRRSRLRRLIITVVLVSVGIHVAAALIAGAVIVARYLSTPPAEFHASRDIRLPAKQREQKMNMAALDSMAPKPSFHDKMQSIRPAAFALPDLPKLDMGQLLPMDPSDIISDQVSGLAGTGGAGSGIGSGASGSGGLGGTGMSFFGIQANGERILLLFDVSTSVVNKANRAGVPLSKIQEETAALISRLPITARFGIIQFTQNYKPFRSELIPATDRNRADALDWIENEWVETGTMAASKKVVSNPRGLVGILELAAKWQPDVIFLISDASFQWKPPGGKKSWGEDIPWKEIKKSTDGGLPAACKIHFIGFEMKPDDKREIGAIARKSGGKLREIK